MYRLLLLLYLVNGFIIHYEYTIHIPKRIVYIYHVYDEDFMNEYFKLINDERARNKLREEQRRNRTLDIIAIYNKNYTKSKGDYYNDYDDLIDV